MMQQLVESMHFRDSYMMNHLVWMRIYSQYLKLIAD